MGIVSQLPHFYDAPDGKKKRNVLQVEAEDAKMDGLYPKDGSITIRMSDDTTQKAFKMTPQEALHLAEELNATAKELLAGKRNLWKAKSKPQQ